MASLSLKQIGNLLGQPVEATTANERRLAERLFNKIANDNGQDHLRANRTLYLKTWQLIRRNMGGPREDH